jgi:hypothetical protein
LKDTRPPFDKSAYEKTVWSAANPWWPPNKSRTHGGGGPDFAWDRFSDDGVTMWQQVAERYKNYGMTGLQMEIIVRNAAYVNVYKNVLEGFKRAGNGFKAELFMTGGHADVETAKGMFLKCFDEAMPELKEHPNAYRLNGHPVVVVYQPGISKPEDWKDIIAAVEEKHGRMIWLANAAHVNADWLRRYLPYFDGISMYANWSESMQVTLYDDITQVMHKEFPQKIFEGGVHTTYCVHFHYGGVAPKLTEKYRNSWRITLDAKPDALTITNWFDTYENSRIMPSYELEDSTLRIAQHELAKWRGQEPPETESPDLYIANYTNVLLGQPLHFEVIGFPVKGEDKDVTLRLEICDAKENVLRAFPERRMALDDMKVEVFEAPSEDFVFHRAVFPRLHYTFKNRSHATYLLPGTSLVTSIRPHMLFWVRSVKRLILIDTSREWTLENAGNGETADYPERGTGVLRSTATSNRYYAGQVNRGGGWARILRNGREIESFGNWDLKFTRLVRMPHPGATLDWYNLELENGAGGRYLSPPIWVTSGERDGMVRMPILLSSGEIRDVQVEAARVPFFQYDCEREAGAILYDSSGYEHHGFLGGKGYGGGHLARTGYRHEHTGKVTPEVGEAAPKYRKDEGGRAYLEFDGSNYVMIQGGTAFPYASTYELFIRPAAIGTRQGILGAPNGQISVFLTEEGKVEAIRSGAEEGMGASKPTERKPVKLVSEVSLTPGRWTHVAVVYDLRELSLFVGGKQQASARCAPLDAHEWINAVVLGGTCKFPYNPVPSFVGGIRRARFYGRNLLPEEFLKE